MQPDMQEVVTHDVVVARSFDAPPERVWRAWTEGAEVMKWWGPSGWSSPEARMDVREGGYSVVLMRSPEGQEMWMRWEYTRVVANERLEYVKTSPTATATPSIRRPSACRRSSRATPPPW